MLLDEQSQIDGGLLNKKYKMKHRNIFDELDGYSTKNMDHQQSILKTICHFFCLMLFYKV